MVRQRISVLISASIGAFATFMPWANVPIVGSIDGTKGDGWITLVLFLVCVIVAVAGDTKKIFNAWALFGVIVPSIMSVMLAMVKIRDINALLAKNSNFYGEVGSLINTSFSVGFGLYVIIISGVVTVILSLVTAQKEKDFWRDGSATNE